MWDAIIDFLSAGIQACSAWFNYIMQGLGALPYILTFFLAYSAFRFLLLPIFGRFAGSDRVSSKNKNKSS